MQSFVEEMKGTAEGQVKSLASCFGVVVSQDNATRTLKVMLEPYGMETGWLRVMNWPYLHRHVEIRALDSPDMKHQQVGNHGHDHCVACVPPPPDPVNPIIDRVIEYDDDKDRRYPNEFSRYNWVGQEVVVLMLYGDISSGVVLGPLW